MSEEENKQLCPRREFGPFKYPEFDTWDSNRWDKADSNWNDKFIKPRTCSFCGGVNVDDLIILINQGWRLSATTKTYKYYIYPPDGVEHPLPCIKFYVIHATQEQIDILNNIIKERNQ